MHRVRSLILAALLCCLPVAALAQAPASTMTWILPTVNTTQANLLVVVYAPGHPAPKGKVEVYMNGIAIGRGKLAKDGSLACVVSQPGVKAVFTARYLGNAENAPSISTPVAWF